MTESFIWIALIVYLACTAFLLSLSFVQLHLTFNFMRSRLRRKPPPIAALPGASEPCVTVQLPIYNEQYVIERLLAAIAKLNYPKQKLEIQVLDDSTDETRHIAGALVRKYQQEGLRIAHLHRTQRTGFKAGALAEGTRSASGEFIAIFDADFIPRPDFLLRTTPYFNDPRVGMVQTRWEHLNRNYSPLTRLQAIALDAFFIVEHNGRSYGDFCINFNGTAGIWRKACIADAGGWHTDTIAEDLDLSYRAQVRGWKFVYDGDFTSPAELPVMMDALKIQQYRWNKGAAECTRKNLPAILASDRLSLIKKIHAFFHHTNSFSYVCMLVLAALSFPMLVIQHFHGSVASWFIISISYTVSFAFMVFYHWTSYSQAHKGHSRTLARFAIEFPLFLVIFMGLSFQNARAVLEGYFGHKTSFVRTPKFNVFHSFEKWKNNGYVRRKINPQALVEMALSLVFFGGVLLGLQYDFWGFLPFHAMLALGFGLVGTTSLFHSIVR